MCQREFGSGEKIKIAGKGYRTGTDGRGDLILEIKTVVPRQLSKEEKKLYEELKKVSKYNPRQN